MALETYQKDQFAEAGIDKEFVQDNQSRSTRGVLRWLQFQKNHTQGKPVRVTKGEVYDVAVDCRRHSATFGKWVGVTLSEGNKKMFYIPEGFAHGFLAVSYTHLCRWNCRSSTCWAMTRRCTRCTPSGAVQSRRAPA